MNQIYTESHENDAVNIACNISSEDAIVLVELDKAFTLFQSKATLWFAVYKDYLDLQGYLDTLLENHYSSLRLLNDPEVLSSISRYVSNFLSSSSIMLTILEQDFPSSESKNDWNLKRRDLHKNNIEYQFCYELRNYSQHYNLPINTIGKLYDENSIPYIFIGFYLPNKDNKVCRKIDRILLSMDKSINVSHY
ncbi:hypothetical protein, partial [Salinivibrio sp. AR640]|uniref:hypothetical protein n=1 Tax=Salinivibrio sp. AR640 TaxID=1909437 RepID=UPI0009CDF4A2